MKAVKKYVAHLDHKNRTTLRGKAYEYYDATEYDNGCIILVPRANTPDDISPETLEDMRKAAICKADTLPEPVDLSKL
ncbi:MAG: hypothetical protein LUD51_07755 [Clostridia bacterium]|nr:hypothetical protein [Clostridia bacterium]